MLFLVVTGLPDISLLRSTNSTVHVLGVRGSAGERRGSTLRKYLNNLVFFTRSDRVHRITVIVKVGDKDSQDWTFHH